MASKKKKNNEQILPFNPSTLETIDRAVFEFINDKMDPYCNTNKGWSKVPINWVTAERAFHSRNSPERRDLERTIVFPAVSIERIAQTKNQASKGVFYAYVPDDEKGGVITITKRIKQDKTANFRNADSKKLKGGVVGNRQENFPSDENKKVVYQTISIPQPTYVQVDYRINLRSEYQQQMNEMLQPFIANPRGAKGVIITHDCHRYEAFLEEQFAMNNNIANMDTEERRYETSISLRVYGYLVGAGKNEDKPKIITRENAVEVKFQRERVIFGDIPEHTDDGKYRP